ncbi:MAG: hypothetical protein RL120_05080 [Gammaproteobacteria bacterium]
MTNYPRVIVAVISLILSGCAAVPEGASESPEMPAEESALEIRELVSESDTPAESRAEPDRQQLIADILFEGLQALDADRLLTPVDDNAHARFQRVLAYDPDNEIALQGLQDIVLRYIELASDAAKQGLFEDAQQLLERARFVDEEHPLIAATWLELQAEMSSGDLFFQFDNSEMLRRTELVTAELADVARLAREHGAFFLITAPSDETARWMYSVMRDAVDGYRLRGNIELAGRTSIRLRMPELAE